MLEILWWKCGDLRFQEVRWALVNIEWKQDFGVHMKLFYPNELPLRTLKLLLRRHLHVKRRSCITISNFVDFNSVPLRHPWHL